MSALVLAAHVDPEHLASTVAALRGLGHAVLQAESASTVREHVVRAAPDVVVGDLVLCRSAPLDGLWPPALLVCGGEGSGPPVELPLSLFARWQAPAGALHAPPPAAALDALLAARAVWLDRAETRRALAARAIDPLGGPGAEARRLRDQVARIASTPRTTTLILGGPGSGRRSLARALHERSPRAQGACVILDVARAAPGELEALVLCAGLEGREGPKGTGGAPSAPARARDGTLCLHRVDALSGGDQAWLAGFLLERTWIEQPSGLERALSARLVATAGLDLAEQVEQGRFREDLYSRLNVMSARIAPLAGRPADVAALARQHAARAAAEHPELFRGEVSPAALDALRAHAWPGNEAELAAVLERALWLAGPTPIGPRHLALGDPRAPERAGAETLPLGDRSWKGVEEALIRRVLEEAEGNRSRAARMLGVNRATLYNKLRAYRIED